MIKCWGSVGFINIGVIGVSDRIWGLNVYRYCFKYYINFNYFKFIVKFVEVFCWMIFDVILIKSMIMILILRFLNEKKNYWWMILKIIINFGI